MEKWKIALPIVVVLIIIVIIGFIVFSGQFLAGSDSTFSVTGAATSVGGPYVGSAIEVPIHQNVKGNLTYIFIPYVNGKINTTDETIFKNIAPYVSAMTPTFNETGVNGVDVIATPPGNQSDALQKTHVNVSPS